MNKWIEWQDDPGSDDGDDDSKHTCTGEMYTQLLTFIITTTTSITTTTTIIYIYLIQNGSMVMVVVNGKSIERKKRENWKHCWS